MANKFIKGLTEKTSILADDWLIMQPEAEESIAYKIKKTVISSDEKPFDKVYYAYSGGNDGTAVINNPSLPYALPHTASVAAKAEKDANGTNVLVYIFSGGAIYDNEINQDDIPIFAEDGAIVWTDVANRSVISDRHIGTAVINITGKGTFVHSSPDPSLNQQAVNTQNAGTTSSIQADLIDSVQLSGSFLPTLNLYDCKVLVGLTPANAANTDAIYERCILKYGILSTNYRTSNSNITYLNCFGICENIYDTEIYDKEGNLITTVDVSNLIADRLADAYAWRCPVVGASGNGNVTVAGVQYAITFNSSEEQTVDDFVDTHEAALLAVADQVILKRWKEITLTGTSGTATITLAGTPYLATFNTDLETTAADFITTHGAAITTQGYKVVQFGGVLAFSKTTEASFTLTIANASGDLNGTISYQFYLRALYDNDIVVSYAQSVADLTVTFVDYFTLTELENRIATNVSGEYGYSGLYFQQSSSQVGADARGAKVTILDSTILLRKSKSIGAKIIFREDEINGRYGGVILRNFRIFLDGGSNNTAMIWGKDDSLVTPKELDLFSFQHQCANGPREITASGYSAPVIRSNDPSIDNYKDGKSAAFSESIKADAPYVYPDQVQSGAWNFTKDASVVDNKGLLNGVHYYFESDGSDINFDELYFNAKVDKIVEGATYFFTSLWRGLKFSTMVVRQSAWTPLDLGSKLINWYDGQIVDVTGTDVNNWIDQKGSIDFANNGNKATYDAANDLIIFDSANSEGLESDANVASYNRATGEYWLTIDYVSGIDTRIISLTDDNVSDVYLYSRVNTSGEFSFLLANGAGTNVSFLGTTNYGTGKLIIRVKQDGVALLVEINGLDVTSENTSASPLTTEWESYPTSLNRVRIGMLINSGGSFYYDLRKHSLIRSSVLNDEEASELYTYLNEKY